jgi:hypothetical protein
VFLRFSPFAPFPSVKKKFIKTRSDLTGGK